MRTIVNADATVACLPRIQVRDGNTVWTDLTSRLFSVSLNDDLDADSASVTLGFRNHPDCTDSLDPLDTTSSYFINSEPLLGRYHELKLEVTKDDGANWAEVFRGYVGPDTVTVSTDVSRDDTVTVQPCDLSFSYKEYYFYDSLIYKNSDAVSIMSMIFADHGFAQTVTEIDAPGFHIEEIRTGETNVWAAQKALIEPTGFIYKIKWHVDAFKPCVYDPIRGKTAPDAVFTGTFSHRKLDISEADVRTMVVVLYRDRNTGTICYAQSESEASRDKYGIPDGKGGRKHKTIWVAMQGTGGRYSMIDTPGEAKTLADYILHDLREPTPDIEIRLPRVHPGIEIHDLLSFIGSDYTVNVGVTSITWNWSAANPIGETVIRGTSDRVIGEGRFWLARDAHSPDVQRELEAAFMQGDGKPPARLAKPEVHSFWGVDSATGLDVPVVVATVIPSHVWDHSHYLWKYTLNDEMEPTSVTTSEPRVTLKGLPVGATLRIWVHDVDWSVSGG